MKKLLFLFLPLFSICINAQENTHDIRRTIGINFSPLNASDDHEFYRSKFGLIYRQCFSSYVLQVEAYKSWQGHQLYSNTSKPVFIDSDTVFTNILDLSYKNMNMIQVGLLKGWTNDISNLYLGVSLNGGVAKESGRYTQLYYTSYTDSATGNVYNHSLYDLTVHEESNPKYLKIGLVFTAQVELRLTKRLSTILQFSPEFSSFWKMNASKLESESAHLFTSDHYKQMTHNGVEISLNYRL